MPKIPFWVFVLVALLHISAVSVDVMDIDASQYAEISREMMESGDYLHIYDRGRDYLDKPPLLFWISAVGMKIFGVNNFGFKFPSILFALWALYATYRLARLLYDEKTARVAALVLGVCQGMFLMTNDIRTDTVLMSWVITAIWLIKEWEVHKRLHHLLLGCAAIAFGMMTKGPIALMVPIFCFATDWALKRDWKSFLKWQYLLGLTVIGILLIPMSIGLYQQFDMHLDKTVNDIQGGVSGLKFFYWDQSFGRITGESKWNNGAGIDFLMLNMLWAFLPWIILFWCTIVINTSKLVKQRFRLQPNQEWLTTGGFIVTYLALGSSKFQLPHYIFVVFPLAAIMVAKLLVDFVDNGAYGKLYRIMRPTQIVLSFILFVFSLALIAYVFPASIMWYVIWAVFLMVMIYVVWSKKVKATILWSGVVAVFAANVIGTYYFYPKVIDYQVGVSLPKYMKENNILAQDLIRYREEDPLNSLHFYAQQPISMDSNAIAKGKYVLTMDKGIAMLTNKGYNYDTLMHQPYFRVSKLNIMFMQPDKRPSVLNYYYLLKIK